MARPSKPPHPADIANANLIAAAVRFDIALFLGRGAYARDTAETLDEARAKAERLAAENPNSRQPLIYGITADGRLGLVTSNQPATKETETMATTKKSKKAASRKSARKGAPAKRAAAKKAAAPQAQANGNRPLGKRAQIEADARSGKLPSPPNFEAATHTRFRPKLAEVVEMAKAGDLKGLKAYKYEGFVSSSPRAILRYRDLCVLALEAKAAR
jgi:hypothetical protein